MNTIFRDACIRSFKNGEMSKEELYNWVGPMDWPYTCERILKMATRGNNGIGQTFRFTRLTPLPAVAAPPGFLHPAQDYDDVPPPQQQQQQQQQVQQQPPSPALTNELRRLQAFNRPGLRDETLPTHARRISRPPARYVDGPPPGNPFQTLRQVQQQQAEAVPVPPVQRAPSTTTTDPAAGPSRGPQGGPEAGPQRQPHGPPAEAVPNAGPQVEQQAAAPPAAGPARASSSSRSRPRARPATGASFFNNLF